jgi:hypothetical protein
VSFISSGTSAPLANRHTFLTSEFVFVFQILLYFGAQWHPGELVDTQLYAQKDEIIKRSLKCLFSRYRSFCQI